MPQPLPRRASRFLCWPGWALGGMLVAALGLIGLWWSTPSPPSEVILPADIADLDDLVAADPGYLGPQACAACHARRLAEFQKTSHFRACRLPREGDMPGGFEPGKGSHRTTDPALRFEMTRIGGEFFQTAIHNTSAGEVRSRARIDLVYGAARADEVFFSWQDDRLFELPVVWLHPLNCWANASYNRYSSGDFSREATPRCLECHNTRFDHVPGTRNQYRPDHLLLGVTCERCHGPGRDHVAFHQAHTQSNAGHAVVHPGRLIRERQLEVCTQCHSNTPKLRGPAFSYRPGEVLEKYVRTSVSSVPEQDHVANQIQYLRQSKCFQKSDTLTCTTCHDPHRPNNPLTVQNACQKCHKPAHCAEQPRLPAAVRKNCTGCHMPQRLWMNVHFHTEDDRYVPVVHRHEHRIAVYPSSGQEVLLTWYRKQSDGASKQAADRLSKTLVKHWLDEADKRQRGHRFIAAIGALREAYRLDPTPAIRERVQKVVKIQTGLDAQFIEALREIEEKRFPDAIKTLENILTIKPDYALAHGKLGMAYAITGQSGRAIEHLRAVAKSDPEDPYGFMMLGWLSYLEGKAEEAVEEYRQADEVEPFNSKTHYHWGLALMKLQRWSEAIEQFQLVRTIDPNHAGACQGLAHALQKQGQPAKALGFAHRAAQLTGQQNPDILLTLAEAEANTGRFAEAEATAARALALAEKRDPALTARIRLHRDEIQARRQKSTK